MSRTMPQIASDRPLGGRYKLISQLGVGGFGRTFLAEDLHLPGHPCCVIKHLKPQSKNDETFQMARRCFNVEAQVLYHLGSHDQIPQLLAHFEDDQEFYLAQEFIEGEPLTRELAEGKSWSQGRVVLLLKDILQVLTFVHREQVIHRDLKPSNLIRRRRDRKIVLIDFGAVKQVGAPEADPDTGLTNLTISIGTQGYMPNEQLAGKPRFCSDIYAVGVLAIQLLTGIHPRRLGEDDQGEIDWHDRVNDLSPELMAVIDRMVRYDFRERYVDAAEALLALEHLPDSITNNPADFELVSEPLRIGNMGGVDTINQSATTPQIETATSFSEPLRASIEFSNGQHLTLAEEEPVSTALWVPTESMIHSAQSNTDYTQAVGRPHFSGDSSQPIAPGSRRFQPGIMAGLIAAGLAAVGLQLLLPQIQTRSTFNHRSPSTIKASPQLTAEQEAAALVKEGDRLMKQKQYDQAITSYDQAIGLQSTLATAYAGRCEALNQLQRPDEAIVSCNDALAYQPDYPEALWSQGNARLLQNRAYEALVIYEDVTRREPDFAPGWVKRGVALQTLGRSAEALVALDQGIQLERNSPEAWYTKAEALFNLQRYDTALTAINKALQLTPSDPNAIELKQRIQARDK